MSAIRRPNKDRASTLLFDKLVCNIEEFDVGQSCVSGNKFRESVQAYAMPELGSLEVSRPRTLDGEQILQNFILSYVALL